MNSSKGRLLAVFLERSTQAPDLLRESDVTRFRADLWLCGQAMTTILVADEQPLQKIV